MRTIRNWEECSHPSQKHFILSDTAGIVIATMNRMAPHSVCWEWRCVLDGGSDWQGVVVAVNLEDAQGLVEDRMVRAGICRHRVVPSLS